MKKTLAVFSVSTLALGGVLLASPAMAENDDDFEQQLICDVWGADTHNYRVVQTAPRVFDVRMVDLLMFAAGPGEDGGEPGFFGPEYYVPIPQGIRFSENTINLGDGAEAGNFTLSQGVTTVPDENELPVIDSVTGSAPNPGESYVYDDATGTIVWIQDTDAQMVEGVPITPGFPPFIDIDKSAGVLSFNVTLPDSAEGEVDVISGISMTWNTHRYKVTPGEFTWDEEPIEVLNGALEGCSIVLEALPPEEPGEEEPGEEEPGEEEPGQELPSEEFPNEPSEEVEEESTDEVDRDELAATGAEGNALTGIITGLALAAVGAGLLLFRRRKTV